MNPSRALMTTTPRMIAASSHSEVISFTRAAASRTLLNWRRNRISGPCFLPSGKRSGPYFVKRRAASAASSPFAV
jgi:hypothetical protein